MLSVCLLIVWEENRIIVPEIRLQFHRVKHLLHILMQMVAKCPNADTASGWSQWQILSILWELHRCNLEHCLYLSSCNTSANLKHEYGGSFDVILMSAHWLQGLIFSINSIHLLVWGKRWNLNNHIETRRVNQTTSCMQWDRYSASEFTSIDSEHIDPTLSGSDQKVVLARMNIETSYLSLINNELSKRCFIEFRSLDIDLWHTYTVRRCGRYHSERVCECWVGWARYVLVGHT